MQKDSTRDAMSEFQAQYHDRVLAVFSFVECSSWCWGQLRFFCNLIENTLPLIKREQLSDMLGGGSPIFVFQAHKESLYTHTLCYKFDVACLIFSRTKIIHPSYFCWLLCVLVFPLWQPAENWIVSLFAIGEGWHNYHHCKSPLPVPSAEVLCCGLRNP